jgi:Ca2+-binding RTX toxin-like protein
MSKYKLQILQASDYELLPVSGGTFTDVGPNGDLGDDTVTGTSGNDTIYVNRGNDTVNAGDGHDKIYDWGNGNDILNGEGGNDFFDIGFGLGNDTVNGGTGVDAVDYLGSRYAVTVDLYYGYGIGEGRDTLISIENVRGTQLGDTIAGDNNANELKGWDGNDYLNGRGGNDFIDGGYGIDTLIGDNGNDTLYGGANNDNLDGGADADLLIGGLGNDIMSGGAGADTFIFQYASELNGLDTILDFQKGVDKIDLRGIDAKPGQAGVQAFAFDGSQDTSWEEFTDGLSDDWDGIVTSDPGPTINGDTGEIEIRHADGYTYVYVARGDGLIDASFRLAGTINLEASDFLL